MWRKFRNFWPSLIPVVIFFSIVGSGYWGYQLASQQHAEKIAMLLPPASSEGSSKGALRLDTLDPQSATPDAKVLASAATKSCNRLDNLYRAVQLFGLNLDTNNNCEKLNVNLNLTRFLAAAFIAISLFLLVFKSSIFIVKRAWRVGCAADKSVMLLGFGAVNNALARQLGPAVRILAVDRSFDAADRVIAKECGALLVPGDLADEDFIADLKPHQFKNVYVACGSDIASMEVAARAAAVVERGLQANYSKIKSAEHNNTAPRRVGFRIDKTDPVVRVHLSDVNLVENLAQGEEISFPYARGLKSFGLKIDAARLLVRLAGLVQLARNIGQQRVHAVIVGVGNQGEAVLHEVVQCCFAVGMQAPRVTLIDKDIESVKARLHGLKPRLFDCSIPAEARPAIEFVQLDIATTDFNSQSVFSDIDNSTGSRPTAWIFCCGDDAFNLSASLRLELAMQQRRRNPAPVFARLWGAGSLDDGPVASTKTSFLRTFGNALDIVQQTLANQKEFENLAQLIHGRYGSWDPRKVVPLTSGTDPANSECIERKQLAEDAKQFLRGWNLLPENVRESNRAVARHTLLTFQDSGLVWRGMVRGSFPKLSFQQLNDVVNAIPQVDLAGSPTDLSNSNQLTGQGVGDFPRHLASQAFVEHCRWLVDRALAGWQPGERDNRRRQHNNMVKYAEVDENTRRYDLVPFMAMAGACLNSGAGESIAQTRHTVVRIVNSAADTRLAESFISQDANDVVLGFAGPVTGMQSSLAQVISDTLTDWFARNKVLRLRLVVTSPVSHDRMLPGSTTTGAAYLQTLVAIAGHHDVETQLVHLYSSDSGDGEQASRKRIEDVYGL